MIVVLYTVMTRILLS